uniref:COA3 factor n=1 Tax=Accipiter nisus TaxID=211598 RepID=A0A8B9MF73_9AVES
SWSGGPGRPIRPGGEVPFARRIDPVREPGLSPEQRLFMAQVERAQRQRALQRRLRSRNALLALSIGAVTFGICILRDRGGAGRGGGGRARYFP